MGTDIHYSGEIEEGVGFDFPNACRDVGLCLEIRLVGIDQDSGASLPLNKQTCLLAGWTDPPKCERTFRSVPDV